MSEENQVVEGEEDLSLVYDVPVKLHVRLGETTLTIGEILKCGKGSVIPLQQKIGDPFQIMLQSRPLAEGEIVEADDHLAIKITNIFKVSAENNAVESSSKEEGSNE